MSSIVPKHDRLLPRSPPRALRSRSCWSLSCQHAKKFLVFWLTVSGFDYFGRMTTRTNILMANSSGGNKGHLVAVSAFSSPSVRRKVHEDDKEENDVDHHLHLLGHRNETRLDVRGRLGGSGVGGENMTSPGTLLQMQEASSTLVQTSEQGCQVKSPCELAELDMSRQWGFNGKESAKINDDEARESFFKSQKMKLRKPLYQLIGPGPEEASSIDTQLEHMGERVRDAPLYFYFFAREIRAAYWVMTGTFVDRYLPYQFLFHTATKTMFPILHFSLTGQRPSQQQAIASVDRDLQYPQLNGRTGTLYSVASDMEHGFAFARDVEAQSNFFVYYTREPTTGTQGKGQGQEANRGRTLALDIAFWNMVSEADKDIFPKIHRWTQELTLKKNAPTQLSIWELCNTRERRRGG
ncbi:unnamed protein product [Amoebophrya sp. A120]|nr:unnamed protein product [Amoebophrya sp. A120]|eukprot:GSA120T00009039001.1